MNNPIVPCGICGTETNSYDKLCDPCWEVILRIDRFLLFPAGRVYIRERMLLALAHSVEEDQV